MDRNIRKIVQKNKFEALADQRTKTKQVLQGKGWRIYRNKSQYATLTLPKMTESGEKEIQPGRTWEGDDYYMGLVMKGEAALVQIVRTDDVPVETILKETIVMNEEKLILDQPDSVCSKGTVEHVVEQPSKKKKKVEEASFDESKKEVLLTEDPLAGVQILG